MPQPDPRWDRLKDLFAAAAPIPAGERESFLKERGVGDATVAEVLALLGAHEPVDEQPGDTIGPYKLLENLGEGGFGTVWMAEQRAPVQRRVALKVLKAGMDSAQVLARFEQERQALALMQHPNIAQVYDAGTTRHGRPFFVMELVKGIPITDYASRERLTIQQRLELFVQVCRAVQHAHHKGVVHRDIKPRNVLVATADGRPLAKVIDFGIAKAVTGRLTERTLFTEHRAMVGTLEYMSPEQAEGLLDVDTRADVYSLGALLYELLTGSTPFVAAKLLEAGFAEMLRTLREVEPERPSVRVSSKAGAGWAASGALGGRNPKELFGSLRGDLDWVVMKALEKDRARRYGTADGLAVDVESYLRGEAVTAVPPSVGYRVRKFVRRNRGAVAATTVVVILLAIATPLVWHLQRANQVTQGRLEAEQREAANVAWMSRLRSHSGRIASALTMARNRSHQAAVAELDRCPEDLRGWEWHHASLQVEESPRRLASPIPILFRSTSDGSNVLCLLDAPPRVAVFDCKTGSQAAEHHLPFESVGYFHSRGLQKGVFVDGETSGGHRRTAYLHLPTGRTRLLQEGSAAIPAGHHYATLRGKRLTLHEAESGDTLRELDLEMDDSFRDPDLHSAVQVLPLGRHVVHSRWRSSSDHPAEPDHAVLIDTEQPHRRVPVPGLLWVNESGSLHVGRGNWCFDEETGEMTRSAWPQPASSVVEYLSSSHAIVQFGESSIFTAQHTATHFVVDLRTGLPSSAPLALDFRFDDFPLGALGSSHRFLWGSHTVGSLSLETGEVLSPEPGAPDVGSRPTADGLRWVHERHGALEVTAARPPQFAKADPSDRVLALHVTEHNHCVAIRATTRHNDTLFVPDTGVPHRHRHLSPVVFAASSGNGTSHIRQLDDGSIVQLDREPDLDVAVGLSFDPGAVLAVDYSGDHAAVAIGNRLLHLRLRAGGKPIDYATLGENETAEALAVHGGRIAVGRQDGSLHVYGTDSPTGARSWRDSDIRVLRWDGADLQETQSPEARPAAARTSVTHLSWSPDGATILVGTHAGTCSLVRARDMVRVAKLEAHLGAVRGSTWSPDCKRVFTCAEDGTVRCWSTDAPSLEMVLTPLLTLTEPEIAGRPTTVMMTPDGERLACGYDDGSIRVWDTVPWSERLKDVPPLFPSSPK